MEINEQLKLFRQRAGKTQKDVADELGIDKSTYAHYESGRRTPSTKTWIQLAEALHFPVFPAQIQIVYPDGLLDKLETCLKENGDYTDDYKENNRRFWAINAVLDEIYKVHSEAMNIDDLPLNKLMDSHISTPYTFMNVALDVRGEKLINQAHECQSNLVKNISQIIE
ncbi:helix-turn-helix transcriptional regulator [Caproicibacterium amylolyticum]|uniref:Helix-turn-helix transcriptional regulator n=1 Tax=Caproicibacterium amylolyticum TaxID=2766537 RepID=A0A7G9WGP2_9FIRM|nr:helix-turn-helix transcriptional regulator [Caproicibacterium amylolyticum]QNO17854.1 helix-turn-helix transcriptional regulator [Caproicibacterium amylolyticum]